MRASLIAVAVINFFNTMFAALYLLYAVATLGGPAACFLLLPSPLPGCRLPAGKPEPAGSARDPAQDPHRTPDRAQS